MCARCWRAFTTFQPNDERALQVFIFNEFMKVIDTMSIALQVLLGLIGALTLAIGGVGLANIMLVSVTQRTREIGVLKSIGATRGAMLGQFLLEAMAIVTAGGMIGVLIGWARDGGDADLAAARPSVQGHDGHGRHSPADFEVCRGCFHGGAGSDRADCRIAAGVEGLAAGPDRCPALRIITGNTRDGRAGG